MAADVEFAIVQLPSAEDGPTPCPSAPVVAGDTAVSVTATLPAFATVNVKRSEPLGARLPLKVSVIGLLVEGDVELNKSLNGFLQADMIITDIRIKSDKWRTFMPDLIDTSTRADYGLTDQPTRSSINKGNAARNPDM